MELSNKGMDATKRGTIGQAHLIHRNERHVVTGKARTQCTYLQSRKKQYADLQPNKSNLQALIQVYFTDKRHKHTYKTPKKRRDFPWCGRRVLLPRPQLRAPSPSPSSTADSTRLDDDPTTSSASSTNSTPTQRHSTTTTQFDPIRRRLQLDGGTD